MKLGMSKEIIGMDGVWKWRAGQDGMIGWTAEGSDERNGKGGDLVHIGGWSGMMGNSGEGWSEGERVKI